MTGFVFDNFRANILDLNQIISGEEFIYKTNQYKLSIVQDVDFRQDYFIFDGKAYLYSMLTDTSPVQFGDSMPGFARIITDQVHTGDLLLRLDERLALPKEQAFSYSSLDFERYRGPQFLFDNCNLQESKTLIVHIDSITNDKLLMVVKKIMMRSSTSPSYILSWKPCLMSLTRPNIHTSFLPFCTGCIIRITITLHISTTHGISTHTTIM